MSNPAGLLAHRISRRNLLFAGIAAVGLGGFASAWRGFAQQAAHTLLEPTRSTLPAALLRTGQTLSA